MCRIQKTCTAEGYLVLHSLGLSGKPERAHSLGAVGNGRRDVSNHDGFGVAPQ